MARIRLVRPVLALAFTLATLLSAAPASAAIIIEGCHMNCGAWSVLDTPSAGQSGAVCRYEKPGFDLDTISIRPPSMFGYYANKTKVQWRFIIRRAPVGSGVFQDFYKSTWQESTASQSDSAGPGDGFSRRTWTAPENPHGYFDVWIKLRWLKNGTVDGVALANYEYFKTVRGSSASSTSGHCLEDY